MFPINPDVFDAEITVVAAGVHRLKYSGVIDGVAFERGLQPVFAGTPHVEVACILNERLDLLIRQADASEVGVIKREGESWDVADHSLGFPRIWGKRADVGLDGEDEIVSLSLLNAPC